MVILTLKNDKKLTIDRGLMHQLDTLIYNIRNDWDFVMIVTGDRMVRTGKSVIAQQLGAYCADKLETKFDINNIFFDSEKMIDFAQEAPPNSVLIYDEGREGLAATKHAKKIQQDLLDYFSECGQLNHIFIIVLPDFFELKENIAVARSEYLINVFRKNINKMKDLYKDGEKRPVIKFERGYFEFFPRRRKQLLYDLAKSTKKKYYQLIKAPIAGKFFNNYMVDEEQYRKKKKEALARFRDKKESEVSNKTFFRDREVIKLTDEGKSSREIERIMAEKYEYQISHTTIQRIVRICKGKGIGKEHRNNYICNNPKESSYALKKGSNPIIVN